MNKTLYCIISAGIICSDAFVFLALSWKGKYDVGTEVELFLLNLEVSLVMWVLVIGLGGVDIAVYLF